MPRPVPNGTSPELLRPDLRIVDVASEREMLEAAITANIGAGFVPRNWSRTAYGSKDAAGTPVEAAPQFRMWPESEWYDGWLALEAAGVAPWQIKKAGKIKSRSQGGSSGCWFWSFVQCLRFQRFLATGTVPEFSPTGSIVWATNGRDVGGNMDEALAIGKKFGITTVDEVPLNHYDLRLITDEVEAAAKRRRVLEGFDLPLTLRNGRPRPPKERLAVVVSSILSRVGFPATGHDFMAHAVGPWLKLLFKSGKLSAVSVDNSGLYRDGKGETIFPIDRMAPQDACIPTVQRVAA